MTIPGKKVIKNIKNIEDVGGDIKTIALICNSRLNYYEVPEPVKFLAGKV